jgi:tetratricopeptide (TPR) repeat protein
MCWARAAAGSDLASALADCQRAVRQRPDVASVVFTRGFVYLRLNRLSEALADFEAALKIDPKHDDSLFCRGIVRRRQGDIAGGDSDIAAAKAINPEIAAQYATLGIVP